MNKLLLVALLALPAAVQAQGIYRCGNTFSQQPCGPDSKQLVAPKQELRLPPDIPPSNDRIAANMSTCEKATRAAMKDPDAARIRRIGRIGPVFQWVAGQRGTGVAYHLGVNGKNSYGGYTGEKLYVCGFDDSETTLVFNQETDRAPR